MTDCNGNDWIERFVDWVAQQYELKGIQDWNAKKVTKEDVAKMGGSYLLNHYYNGSLQQLLESVYTPSSRKKQQNTISSSNTSNSNSNTETSSSDNNSNDNDNNTRNQNYSKSTPIITGNHSKTQIQLYKVQQYLKSIRP